MLPSQYLSALTHAARLFKTTLIAKSNREQFHVVPRFDVPELLPCFGKTIMFFPQVIHQQRFKISVSDGHDQPGKLTGMLGRG